MSSPATTDALVRDGVTGPVGGAVLFATIAAGGGHVATATAMAEAVTTASAGTLDVRVSDIMAEYGPRDLDRRHKDSWRRLLARPRLVRTGQMLTDSFPALTRLMQDTLLNGFARDITAVLDADPPALVVVNHGWLATAFTLARRRHRLRSRVVIYATEPFDASALWSTPDAEVVLAPSAAARSALTAVGVPAQRVLVAGYPVADRFLRPPGPQEARASLGLDAGFTCLITLGAEGVVDADATNALLGLAAAGVNLLCVTGRNAALKARLDAEFARSGGASGQVQVFGFVPDMERLLSAADLVVGKAGPASTMEALAVGRPVVATAYAGLNELAVTRFLESRRVGEYVPGWQHLGAAVSRWRTDPGRLAEARTAAEQLDFVAMKRGIGGYLAACATQADGAGTASFLSAADRLEPGPLGSVTRTDLRAAAARGDGSRPARGGGAAQGGWPAQERVSARHRGTVRQRGGAR